ncbi:hypothetical protein SESBI_46307 [Sesbania bispinosa]|nr:hypothetical protein SESBI_46307 [Sesbania bispinosa]
MANTTSPSLQLPNPFPLSSSSKLHFHSRNYKPFLLFTTRVTEPQNSPSDFEPPAATTGDDFDNRMNEFRIRNQSGTGKKAEIRKALKSKKGTSGTGSSVYLPPVPLKEAVFGGLKVELGFSPYSERLNGRIAILGLTALFWKILGKKNP